MMRKEGRENFVVISKKKEEKKPKTLITDREPSALSWQTQQ